MKCLRAPVAGGHDRAMKIRIGLGLGPAQLSAPGLRGIAAGTQEHGFDSLWISEVLTGAGPDPLTALAWAAGAAPRLKVGATMLLPGRNEIRLAKSLATLDVLSDGRLLLVMVPGLTRGPERDAIGAPVRGRGETIEAVLPKLRRWWAGEEVDGVTIQPRPLQDPIEVWLGGIAAASLQRCGRVGDGWLGAACTPAEAGAARRTIEQAAADAGREVDPEHFGLSIGYSRDEPTDAQLAALAARVKGRDIDPRSLIPVGIPALRSLLESLIDQGLSKFVVRPSQQPGSWDEELAELAEGVLGLQT